jgi:magnesium transporter
MATNLSASRVENSPTTHHPESSNANPQAGSAEAQGEQTKKKKRRGGKKHKRARRPSFAAPSDLMDSETDGQDARPSLAILPERASQEARNSFYRIGRGAGSATSLESEALLDHRDSGPLQTRRQSIVQGLISGRLGQPSSRNQGQRQSWYSSGPQSSSRLRRVQHASESENDEDATDRTPLMATSIKNRLGEIGYGGFGSPRDERPNPFGGAVRRPSSGTSRSSRRQKAFQREQSSDRLNDYHVNNPPSVPGSPKFGVGMGFDDVILAGDELDRGRQEERPISREVLIDIDENAPIDRLAGQAEVSTADLRRRLAAASVVDDVCFPQEDMTELGEEDTKSEVYQRRRRRRREWPDLEVLEEWAVQEKEQRNIENRRVREVSEPVMINGRLRPTKQPWHRDEEDQPLRFTYFNEDFNSTLHSESLSELLHGDLNFRNLFIPDPSVLSDSESEDEGELSLQTVQMTREAREESIRKTMTLSPPPGIRAPSIAGSERRNSRTPIDRKPVSSTSQENSNQTTGRNTPIQSTPPKQKRYGPRPIWWLDVLCPTEPEMKVLSKAFGIHPLTAEDVMMREQREKVELFRNYYFISYRSFEQDSNSEDHLEPVSIYVVVFRDGVISFHFSQTPHPANVRRRIRQLKDYLLLTTDWISYAIIDDITDGYFPLIEQIEDEVDEIDEIILQLHNAGGSEEKPSRKEKTFLGRIYGPVGGGEKQSESGQDATIEAGDMLRQVGECRKKVMGMYRLLGNKADVIKGFAKRCNEQWEIAPRSDIGLYLGDIQDHIVTMTGNLSHYEK